MSDQVGNQNVGFLMTRLICFPGTALISNEKARRKKKEILTMAGCGPFNIDRFQVLIAHVLVITTLNRLGNQVVSQVTLALK